MGARIVAAVVLMIAVLDVQAAVGRTPGSAAVSPTGEATYTVPIFAPPGTNGMTPVLSLNYSSNGGSGWIGQGWNIGGLSAITRCGKTWAQDGEARNVRLDANDRFCLDGNRLRTASGDHGANGTEYRTEVETFARIRSWGVAGNGPAYFIAEMKDGLIYEYGNSESSRIESQGVASVRTWALNRIRDRNGNAILFNYTEDAANGSYRLANVQYTANDSQGLAPAYQIEFLYEAQPEDEIDELYFGGQFIRDVVRLVRIDVKHESTLVRRYHISYEPNLSNTGKSRVSSIQECAGSAGTDCLGATTFTYQDGTPGVGAEINTGVSVPTTPWIMDVNGDGRDDLVYSSSTTSGAGTWMVMLANGSGFAAPINTGITNTNFSQAIRIDYNADGLQDLLVPYSGGTWWVMLGSASGLSAPVNTGTPTTATGVGVNAHAIDVNGDGLEDLVWADLVGFAGGDAIRYRLRSGSSFSSTVGTLVGPLPADSMISNPVWGYTQPPGLPNPDFNGDGRDDLLYQRIDRVFVDGEQNTWNYTYYTVAMSPGANSPQFATGVIGPPTYGDFNGDGFSDLVYIRSATISGLRFGTGTGFSGEFFGPSAANNAGAWQAYDWDGDGNDDILVRNITTGVVTVLRCTGQGIISSVTTGITSSDIPRAADINGDGLQDLVYVDGGSLRYRLHAGSRPDVLLSATDGYGNVTSFAYTTIAQGNYTKHSDAIFPEQDYIGPLPVVHTMTSANGIGGSYTLSYWYYGARVHRQGRGLEGFKMRRVHDSRTGLYSYEYFHQLFPLTGRVYRAEVLQSNNSSVVSRVDTTWAVQEYGSGVEERKLPYPSTSVQKQYELGGAYDGALISTATTVNSLHSGTGTIYKSVTTTVEEPTANGVQAGASYVTQVHLPVSDLTNDTSHWCIGRPGLVESSNSHNQFRGQQVTRTTEMTWNTEKCRPETIIVEPNDSQLQVTRSLAYDAFGNVSSDTVTGVGMSPRTTQVDYGSRGQFPITVTNALSQSTTNAWNYAKGVLVTQTDPNGIATHLEYDNFGRVTRVERADGTATTWSYQDCASSTCSGSQNRTVITEAEYAAGGAFVTDARTYLDRFDRPIGTSSRMFSGIYNRVETEYDALGRVRRTSAPCWWTSCTLYWTEYTYDALGRVTRISRPVSDSDATEATTRMYYEGLTTRIVDALGKQTTKVGNVIGQVARSLDHTSYFQHFDYDAFGNLVRVVDSTGSVLMTNEFNVRGMRIAQSDIAAGSWTYAFNALGEVVQQIDANSQETTFEYDALGRIIRRSEPEGQSDWIWGSSAAAKNIGKLTLMSGPGYAEGYEYDAIGRLARTTIASDATYHIDYTYNSLGALDTLTYPASTSGYRLKLKYEYQNGYLAAVRDYNAPSTVFWTANDTDARGNIISESLGNGVQTIRGHDTVTGLLDYLQSGVGGSVQDLNYFWDPVGNLTQRQDARQGITENFYYDDLHRLTSTTGPDPITLSYDARGNVLAMTGDVKNGIGHTIDWFSYNLPRLITGSAGNSSEFFYGPDRSRWKQVAFHVGGAETTVYIGGLIEKVTTGTTTSWKHIIAAPNGAVALYIRRSDGTNETLYLTKDHLGSVDTITSASGAVALQLSFGSFGTRRRGEGWAGEPTSADWAEIADTTRHGFTGHEMLDNLDLVHMNGRVYDPRAARFISPDPFIDGAGHTQGWNRYAYVKNNPLSLVDPSGFGGCRIVICTPDGYESLHEAIFAQLDGGWVSPDQPDFYDLGLGSSSIDYWLLGWMRWTSMERHDMLSTIERLSTVPHYRPYNRPRDFKRPPRPIRMPDAPRDAGATTGSTVGGMFGDDAITADEPDQRLGRLTGYIRVSSVPNHGILITITGTLTFDTTVTKDQALAYLDAINRAWNTGEKYKGVRYAVRTSLNFDGRVSMFNPRGTFHLTDCGSRCGSSVAYGASIPLRGLLMRSGIELFGTEAHEFGHVLGLDHRTRANLSIMNSHWDVPSRRVTGYDLYRLEQLYGR